MALFIVSAILCLIAALGIVDAFLPDDDFWSQFDED
jgi:hypothetical protein